MKEKRRVLMIKIVETKSKALCNLTIQMEQTPYEKMDNKCRELKITKKAFINTAILLFLEKIEEFGIEK